MNTSQIFTQAAPASIWVITHAFTTMPICDVTTTVNGHIIKILPLSIKSTSSTELVITFTSAYAGTVRLVGQPTSIARGGSADPGAYSRAVGYSIP